MTGNTPDQLIVIAGKLIKQDTDVVLPRKQLDSVCIHTATAVNIRQSRVSKGRPQGAYSIEFGY